MTGYLSYFDIPEFAEAVELFQRLVVINVLGQVVRTVKEGDENPGVYALEIDLTGLPGGVYFCRLEAGGFTETRRIVLL